MCTIYPDKANQDLPKRTACFEMFKNNFYRSMAIQKYYAHTYSRNARKSIMQNKDEKK